jgi:hypothetical protein
LKANHDYCLFVENTKDFPVLESIVLGGPTNKGSIQDSMVVETLVFYPHKPVVEEDSSLFLQEVSHDIF